MWVNPVLNQGHGAIGGVRRVEAFRRGDGYLGNVFATGFLMRAWWQAEAHTLQAVLNTGVADEVMILDRDRTIIDINEAKARFWSFTKSEILGRKCYEACYGCSSPADDGPCQQCPFQEVLATGESKRWQASFVHPVTKHPHVANITTQRVSDSLGRYRIVETAIDATKQEKHDVVRAFLSDMQMRSVEKDFDDDLNAIAWRMLELFRDLKWNRARLYEWDKTGGMLICLGAIGHGRNLRGFRRRVAGDPAEGGDWLSARWAFQKEPETRPILIVLRRCQQEKRIHELVNALGTRARVELIDSWPFATQLHKEGVTTVLDIPLVVGQELIGKVSLDNYDESRGREAYVFDLTDVEIATEYSVILSHVLRSAHHEHMFEALRNYVVGLNHEILTPLQLIMGHAEYLTKHLGVASIGMERKGLKVDDILYATDVIEMIINRPAVEQIQREKYEFEDAEIYSDVPASFLPCARLFLERQEDPHVSCGVV